MVEKKQTYCIFGQAFDQEGLRSFCLEKNSVPGTPVWEKEIWTFILKWLSPEESIEVNTSGSTGKPKQISLQKKYMLESAKATISFFGLKPGDSVLLCLPVKTIAGKMMIVRALVGGLDLQYTSPSSKPHLDRFDKINFAAMTTMQVVNVLNAENGIQSINKIEKLIVGGSGMPFGLEAKLQIVTSEIWQTYGMTETITHIALRKVNGPNKTEWYNCLQGVSINSDERNCLAINYPKIGIENLVTTDVVEFNKSGGFKIPGRIDNVVNSGGVKLFPEQIEKKLEGIIDSEFYISGIPDETLGERLVLIVEGNDLNEAEHSAFFDEIKTKLSGFEVPKKIIFQTTFKRTLSGKVIRDVTSAPVGIRTKRH